MKTFSQLNEESVENKLDKLGHPTKLTSKRVKQLATKFPTYEDIDLEEWQGYPFPKNTSTTTHNELRYLISLGGKRTEWQDEMVMYDLKIIKPFKDYLEDFGIDVDWDRVRDLIDQSSPIILSLKRYYNRPRPKDLANKLSLPLDTFPLKTAGTPSYPSGHATQGRLVSQLVADEVPLEHRKNILEIGQRIGDSRQVAGAHYPSDTEFGHRLGDELYRLSKTHNTVEPDLSLESLMNDNAISNLDEGWRDFVKKMKKKLTRTWKKVKSFISRAFNKLKRMNPGQEAIVTIPGIKQEDYTLTDNGKMILSEGALEAIKGNYNEALVLEYLYAWTGNGVKISDKWKDEITAIKGHVKKWENDLKDKVDNWRPALKIIKQGSVDMTKYLVGTTIANDGVIVGAYLDNLSYQGGAEFKADIQIAVMKKGKEILTGYSLKLYSNKSVGLANTSPKRLAGHLVGPAAEKQVEALIATNSELQALIAGAKEANKAYQTAKKLNPKDPDVKRGGKLYDARTVARKPINPILAEIAYTVIKPHVNKPEFGEKLLILLGFRDKETKMLMAVTTAKKSEILDAHPDLDVSKISLELVGVSIKIVGPTGKTIVSFGTKEGEQKKMSGKVSFADVDPVDLADLPMGQN